MHQYHMSEVQSRVTSYLAVCVEGGEYGAVERRYVEEGDEANPGGV